MDLWIRSQDRQELIKATEINAYQYDESAGLGNDWHIFVRDYEVGVYKSKERALEIINEIQNILKPQLYLKQWESVVKQEVDELVHIVNPTYEEVKELSTYVYEMPKE